MDEYNDLLIQKSNTQADYYSCSKRIANYDYLLKRLRPVKDLVAAKKRAFKTVMAEDKKIVADRLDWEGDQYQRFKSKGQAMITEDDSFNRNTMDYTRYGGKRKTADFPDVTPEGKRAGATASRGKEREIDEVASGRRGGADICHHSGSFLPDGWVPKRRGARPAEGDKCHR